MFPRKAVNPQRWFSAWRSAGRVAPGGDPADMGTAFGLDMSLLDNTPEPPPPMKPHAGWMQRLTARRRTTG